MRRALRLARKGLETTTPNPRVGCVIVSSDGRLLGEGWHERAGEPHAEIHALRQAGAAARGATCYVTLEPCSHHGRTPPCADALIAAGYPAELVIVRTRGDVVMAPVERIGVGALESLHNGARGFMSGGLVPGYSASKGGVAQLTKSLAIAWAASIGGLGTLLAGRSRILAVAAGAALATASALTRMGIVEAGIESAKDPRYTVRVQRDRLERRRAAGIVHDSSITVR